MDCMSGAKKEVETDSHIVIHCHKVRKIWKKASFDTYEMQQYGRTIKEQLWSYMVAAASKIQLVATPVWNIWKARNATIFDDFYSQPADIITIAVSMVKEYNARLLAQCINQEQA